MTLRIEGYAIVSDDGMLADADGIMPASLKIDADQKFLSDGLDRADIIVHGSHSHEEQPQSPRRRRLIATRSGSTLTPASDDPNAAFWNPAGVSLDQALKALGLDGGIVAILGGTDIFGLFLNRYDVFYLSRARGVSLPGGRPVFPDVPGRSPEDILSASGLVPGPQEMLDAARGATLVAWRKAAK
jgi:dihydrofolate reductase